MAWKSGSARNAWSIELEKNPFEDPSWYLAHHILKVNGFTPLWIEKNRKIEDSLKIARKELARAWKSYTLSSSRNTTEVLSETDWEKAASRFREQILRINQQILSYNLQVPSIHFQRKTINAEKEILQLTTTTPSDKL